MRAAALARIRRQLPGLALALALAGCSPATEPATAASTAVPQRIVTLAPHLAELLYTAGAGARLVGVSSWSDFPPGVKALPVVGDAFMLDHEQLALLRPDLLLAWESGTPAHVVDELRARGYRIEVIRTRGLEDVAEALETIGRLAGSTATAKAAARRYRNGLEALRARQADAAAIRVFYQVSLRPLYTVNGDHYVSELIEACGGENVFAGLSELAPIVTEEAVIERDPEVLLAAGESGSSAFEAWQRWPTLAANRYDNHFVVPPGMTGRATTRLLDAGRAVCDRLDEARKRRAAAG